VTPAPKRTASATPAGAAPAAGTGSAESVVRGYLGALARGDRSGAAAYLAGSAPSETFVDSSARIQSVRAESTGQGTYKASADVQTSTGEYYITFTLTPGPGGLQISDHFAIKTGP
jgi:hypothetical protein